MSFSYYDSYYWFDSLDFSYRSSYFQGDKFIDECGKVFKLPVVKQLNKGIQYFRRWLFSRQIFKSIVVIDEEIIEVNDV